MKDEMNRKLVESTIRTILKDMEKAPERTIRKLVDFYMHVESEQKIQNGSQIREGEREQPDMLQRGGKNYE